MGGVWGAVLFGRGSPEDFGLAAVLGAGPDLVSFGPAAVDWAIKGFPRLRRPHEPPDPAKIPPYVFKLYDITHSFVTSGAVFAALWLWRGRPPWIFCAWLFHILCDIPTHKRHYFPTPYLWPFRTPYVNGIRWAVLWFMILNYSALALTYGWFFWPI